MTLARAGKLTALPFATLLALSLTVSPVHATGSSGASDLAVAAGTVTGPGGAAMPGATVDLYAWPSDAVQEALKPGQLVPTTLLATAITSSAGKYMLRVPVARLKAAAVESGYANLEVSSAAGGFWFFPYQTGSLPSHPPAAVTVNLHGRHKVRCGKPKNGQRLYFTGQFKLKQLNPAWGVVGQGYIVRDGSKTKGDTVQFNFNQTRSHTQVSTLGAGISGYGLSAGYTASGTTTATANQAVNFATETQNAWFRTEFNVTQDRGMCVAGDFDTVPHLKQHGNCPRKWMNKSGVKVDVYKCIWAVLPDGWFGISASVAHPRHAPHTPAKFCGFVMAGGGGSTSTEKAVQWSSGFDIGAAEGYKNVTLNASFGSTAQTGYDDNDEMVFKFTHNGWLCGTNHDVRRAAQLVVRGNKN